jgi:hypothetical protein
MTSSFPQVPLKVINTAKKKVLHTLRDPETPLRLARYYDPTTDFAGATFIDLGPGNDPHITPTDLLAVTTLAVPIPNRAIRLFLQDEPLRDELADLYSRLPSCNLQESTASDFPAMEDFYDRVKEVLSSPDSIKPNPWVTTSKLVARKRPDLFPVRDNLVCNYLEITSNRDRAKDWFVYQQLLLDTEVQSELAQTITRIKEAAKGTRVVIDVQPLRLLDAALWCTAAGVHPRS